MNCKGSGRCPTCLQVFLAAWLIATPLAGAERHTLWRIQGPKTTIHLAGSIHFLKPEHYPLPSALTNAYHQARVLVLETDLNKGKEPAAALRLLQYGSCPPGKTLKDLVKPATYAALQKQLGTDPGTGTPMDGFRPWLVAVTLVVIELQGQGFRPEQGLDMHFLGLAQADHKELGELESLDTQLNLFTGLNEADQDLFLEETLREIHQFPVVINRTVEAWKTGDMDAIDELLLKPMRSYPELYRRFLTDRNRNWISRVEDYIRGDKPALIVVGAGHLAGPDSLVELLRKKGHRVEQL